MFSITQGPINRSDSRICCISYHNEKKRKNKKMLAGSNFVFLSTISTDPHQVSSWTTLRIPWKHRLSLQVPRDGTPWSKGLNIRLLPSSNSWVLTLLMFMWKYLGKDASGSLISTYYDTMIPLFIFLGLSWNIYIF